MPAPKAWKLDDPGAPAYPDDFDVVHRAVLQVTDIKTNRNKYYAIEVHAGSLGGAAKYRVFTHYGRTDDLESDPDAGQKECRYCDTLADAERVYETIYREKTSASKGYREISLASSRIGSVKARGTSSGQIDAATIKKAAAAQKTTADAEPVAPVIELPPPAPLPPPPPPAPVPVPWHQKVKAFFGQWFTTAAAPKKAPAIHAAPPPPPPLVYSGPLHAKVAELVDSIYGEATSALTSTVAVKITAHGMETPLGVLTLGQIEKGEAILQELYAQFQKKKHSAESLERLSGEFYTVIPHRIGRTRAAVQAAVIDSFAAFEQKQETLQLMKDMLQVNGEGNVLYHSKTDHQFAALRCGIDWVDPSTPVHQQIRDFVVNSQIKSRQIKVLNIFTVRRDNEVRDFASHIGNEQLLFHGSRIRNWVGILSRGILLPKIAVSLGVNRTDAGWLGNGIYFGDAASTSSFYTSPGRRGTRLMALARVSLGRVKEFQKITYGLTQPPAGYDSCHGVRSTPARRTDFADDEYVVYNPNQQKLEYLVEFRM